MNQGKYKYPLISIIIPLYNVERYVVRCLDSVMSQNYNGKIECILIDDYGGDNSLALAKEFISNNTNPNVSFKLICHNRNQGVSAARNHGTEAATGDYIFYLDADDYIYPNTISLLVAETQKHPKVDVVMGMYNSDYGDTEYKELELYKKHQFETNKEWIQYHYFKHHSVFPITCWNKLVRLDFIKENHIEFFPATIHEDNHWLFQVLDKIKSFAFVFEKTYHYCDNTSSAINTTNTAIEKENWHRIILSYSKSIHKPLKKLKLGRIMHIYFYQKLYEYNFPKDKELRKNLLWICLSCGRFKTAAMLFVMVHFQSLSLKWNIPERIRQKAYWLYMNESNNPRFQEN